MNDPFTADVQRRAALMERVYSVRLALYEAHEQQDAAAALKALGELYALVESVEGAQVLYVGDDPERSVAFAPPTTCVQMVSRWGGVCILCDDRIKQGELMYWDKADRSMTCARCSVGAYLGSGK